MKKIDAYILKKFLGTFVYSLSLIIIIVIVFDISEKMDDFISRKVPMKEIIFDHYVNFIPYFANMFSPLFTFIAVIFFTSRMAYRTEIVAILSSGVSFKRLLYPYFLGASIIGVGSLILSNFIIPHANKGRIAFADKYIGSPFRSTAMNIHRQYVAGNFIYMSHFDVVTKIGYEFSLEHIVENKLQSKLMSESARYDSATGKWQARNYFIRTIKADGQELLTSGTQLDTAIAFSPNDLGRKTDRIETMNYLELTKFIAEERQKGAGGIEFYEIEKYKRIAFPFATFILTLIGVALSSRKVRGGIGLHLGLGLLISFTFILFMQVSSTFAVSGVIAASVAVWIPNFIFLGIALLLLKNAPK